MNTNIQTRVESPNKLAMLLAQPGYVSRFNEVLKDRAPQFMSSIIQVGRSLGDDCDPLTIISGSMTAATLDLPINKSLGYAWLVPYKEKGVKKAQFQMGFKGYIQLALRTGRYRRMNAGPVNKECLGGYNNIGERIVDFTSFDPYKPAAGYFFAFEMVNGFTKMAVWDKQDVEAHAQRYSQSYRGGFDSPWKTHFDEMATKTVIMNELRLWGMLSIEMQTAMERDGSIVAGIDTPVISFPDNGKMIEEGPADIAGDPAEPSPDEGEVPPTQRNVQPLQQVAATDRVSPRPEAKIAAPKPAPKPVAKPSPRPAPAPEPTPEPESGPEQGEAPTLDPRSSQGQLATMVTSNGYTWGQFAAWADEIGVLPDATSLGGFGDMSGPLASRIMRSKDGMLGGLADQKSKGVK